MDSSYSLLRFKDVQRRCSSLIIGTSSYLVNLTLMEESRTQISQMLLVYGICFWNVYVSLDASDVLYAYT